MFDKFIVLLCAAFAMSSANAEACGVQKQDFIDEAWRSFSSAYRVSEASAEVLLAASQIGLDVPVYEVDLPVFNAFAFPNHIVVSKVAAQASKEELRFVLAHERGHIELGHPLAGLVMLDSCEFVHLKLGSDRLQQFEFAADAFAVEYLKQRGIFDVQAARSSVGRDYSGDATSHPTKDARIAVID